MKNLKLLKGFLVTLIVVMISIVGIDVFAANNEEEQYDDIYNMLSNTDKTENKTEEKPETKPESKPEKKPESKPENKIDNNTTTNNKTLNTSNIANNNNVVSNKTNNTSLPKTGAASSTGMIVVLTVCGISAIYAFKKIRDYRSL